MKRNSKSLGVFLFLILFSSGLRFFYFRWQNVLSWDTMGYYLYLPSQFIYNDLDLSQKQWLDSAIEKYNSTATLYQTFKAENGKWVFRYPIGLSILNAPFFFVADAIAKNSSLFQRDGFSLVYQFFWVLGGLFYGMLGLFYLRKILLTYFSDALTALLLLLITLATNLIEQLTLANGGVHNFLFAMLSFALWQTIVWHNTYKLKNILAVAASLGLMVICRPTELLFVLVPVFWNVYDKTSFTDKLNCLRKYYKQLILAFFVGFLFVSPQLLYWKNITGSWVYYSYKDAGVGFDWFNPHTYEFLFSYKKGWFVYNPIMLLAIAGLFMLIKKQRALFVPFFLFLALAIYVASTWTDWAYGGGSYSCRPMVSSYALWAICLGVFYETFKNKNIRAGILVFSFLLMGLNLFQFWQFSRGILHNVRTTKAYYWKVFLKTETKAEYEKYLSVARSVYAYETLVNETEYKKTTVLDTSFSQNGVLHASQVFLPLLEVPYKSLSQDEYFWIRASAGVEANDSLDLEYPLLVVHFTYKDKPYKYVSSENQSAAAKRGKSQVLSVDYMSPQYRSSTDKLKVYLWYRGKDTARIQSAKIELFEAAGNSE
jgi:hypothetical protein